MVGDNPSFDHNQPTDGWNQALNDLASLVLYLDEARNVPLMLRPIPATHGQFWMGSNDPGLEDAKSWSDPSPVTQMEIGEPYWMGAFPVTQLQWRCVVEATQGPTGTSELKRSPSHFCGVYRPVEQVSWDDCMAWLRRLNTLPWVQEQLRALERATGHTSLQLQLPTEAHWEWSCRAIPKKASNGTIIYRTGRTEYHAGDGDRALVVCGWFDANADSKTHAVGRLRPSALGLYDLHGNVWEWCVNAWRDSYAELWDRMTPEAMKLLSSPKNARVVRGGSWFGSAMGCRTAFRSVVWPGYRFKGQGFRVCLITVPIENNEGESSLE